MIPSNRKVKTIIFKNLTNRCDIFNSNYFTLKTYFFPGQETKFSVIVSKKIEKRAVNRNSIKRSVYRELRLILTKVEKDRICLFFVKKNLKNIDFKAIKEDIFSALRKAGVIT